VPHSDVIDQRSPPIRFRRHRRLIRRVRRALRRWGRGPAPISPAARYDLERADELSTAELWSVWTLASLECSVELAAWRLAPRRERRRAFSGYRAALAREGRAAELLAQRH
jgi:hypothetical protein